MLFLDYCSRKYLAVTVLSPAVQELQSDFLTIVLKTLAQAIHPTN